MEKTSEILVILGPTASGKTKLAIDFAKKYNGEVVCADSRSVFVDLDIVSAKIKKEEMDDIPHHMLDIVLPTEDFSAGEFKNRAEIVIDDILKRGKTPIVAGGTWFYVSALLNFQSIPEVPPNYELREELREKSNLVLYDMLLELNEKRAREINPNNTERIIRAIEIAKSGIKETKKPEKYSYKLFSTSLDRAELYERINLRVDKMLAEGLFEEYRKNVEKYGNLKLFSETIGYSEIEKLNNGIYENKEFAIEKIKQHTRNFAKRQLTWIKSRDDIEFI